MKVQINNKTSKNINTKFGDKVRWEFDDQNERHVTTFDDLSQVKEGEFIEGDISEKTVMGRNGEVTYTNFKMARSGASPMFEVLKRMEEKIDKIQQTLNTLTDGGDVDVTEVNKAIDDAVAEDKEEEIDLKDIPF